MPLDQLQQHLEPVFRRQFSIELIIGLIRVFETTEYLNNAVHGSTLACSGDLHHARLSDEAQVDTCFNARRFLLLEAFLAHQPA